MAVNVIQSKLVDAYQVPQIVNAQDAIADANTADENDATVNAILAVLRAHGLIKES